MQRKQLLDAVRAARGKVMVEISNGERTFYVPTIRDTLIQLVKDFPEGETFFTLDGGFFTRDIDAVVAETTEEVEAVEAVEEPTIEEIVEAPAKPRRDRAAERARAAARAAALENA